MERELEIYELLLKIQKDSQDFRNEFMGFSEELKEGFTGISTKLDSIEKKMNDAIEYLKKHIDEKL